jgi:hypothetical protein
MYAAVATRPNIAFAIGILLRFLMNPGCTHWEAVKQVFKYLKGTIELWLTFGNDTHDALHSHDFIGYADADSSMQEDWHAISGYTFLVDGGAMSWSSKHQDIIVLSMTKAKYVAATHAAKEALWLCTFVSKVFGPISNPMTLYSNNQSVIALSKDHQYHTRTKHINIWFHYIHWIIKQGKLRLVYCPTEDMVVDTLTKPLPSAKVKHFAHKLGLCMA